MIKQTEVLEQVLGRLDDKLKSFLLDIAQTRFYNLEVVDGDENIVLLFPLDEEFNKIDDTSRLADYIMEEGRRRAVSMKVLEHPSWVELKLLEDSDDEGMIISVRMQPRVSRR